MKKRKIEITIGKQSESEREYRSDCLKLSPSERLAFIQELRIAFWGDEASTGRLQRVPEFIKHSRG